jgi:predicted dehydrogenase
MAHRTWRFAIIGCGRMGRLHTERLHADGRGRVVALFDRDRESSGSLRRETAPDAAVCDELPSLLQQTNLDAAVVCTPTTSHYEQTLACRARGLHVLCEKPLAESRDRIVALVNESRLPGPHCVLAYQRRFWSTFRTLRREVQSGRWGPVRAVTSHNVEHWQPTIAGTWRDDPAINVGGFVGDAGSHKIDGVFYVTGLAPREVFARSWNCGSRVPIVSSVSAVLEGDVPLCMDFIGHAQCLGEDLHVHCAEADLMVRDRRVWIARGNCVEPLENIEPESDPDRGFLDLLDGEAPNVAPFECALPVFETTMAILESSRTGRSVGVGITP